LLLGCPPAVFFLCAHALLILCGQDFESCFVCVLSRTPATLALTCVRFLEFVAQHCFRSPEYNMC
jgi:hypothetical protein